MAEKKQLILLVEGTAALGPYWRTIVSDYLEKVIRSFCGVEDTKPSTPIVELALVMFNAHGPYSPFLVRRSSWTKNLDIFLEWLSSMHFNGGGFSDAAIAEGLAEVLMMFPSTNGDQTNQENEGFQRHCILVAASNPYPLPTPVYNKMHPEIRLYDAETLAKSFPQCFVSLSVICPRQLPKLKAIYNAGKTIPNSAMDHVIDIVKNPHYLVLISESFMEGSAALCPPLKTDESPKKTEVTPVSSPLKPSCQETTSRNENVQDLKPVVSVSQQPTNADILNNLSKSRLMNPTPVVQSVSSCGQSSMTSVAESATLAGTAAQVAQETSATCNIKPTPEIVQSETSKNQNKVNDVVQSGGPSFPLQSGPSKYVKLWEGNLFGQRQGQSVLITRLQCFRSTTSSETLAEDWPSSMKISRLISQEHMQNKQYAGKAEFLVFRAMNQHGFLTQMKEKKLCTVIKLPSQTLLLSVSDKPCRLIGMLFPQEMVIFKPQISKQPQQVEGEGKGEGEGEGGSDPVSTLPEV